MITVLSPHMDDAAFSAGLAIGIWLEHGHLVEVMNCFTRSRYSPLGGLLCIAEADLQTSVTAMRHEEDLLWTGLYRQPVKLMDLGLTDAPQRLQCKVIDVCAIPVDRSDLAIAQIRTKLEMRPFTALVLPLGIGDHVDHLTTRIAAQDGWPDTLPLAFYEDLPYSARPDADLRIRSHAKAVSSELEPCFASEDLDVKAAREMKRTLALCYGSQIDETVTDQIASFCERYGGRERFWANQAWRDAGLAVVR